MTAARSISQYMVPILLALALSSRLAYGASFPAVQLQILPALQAIRDILAQAGPVISAILFIMAGIFYSVGQMLNPDKKAQFHTTSINLVIGAVVIAALSFASTTLALASAHLLVNATSNALNYTS